MSLLLQSPLARVRRIVAGPLGLPSPLAGRTVLVTGASSGIGEATAYAVARTGATVLLVARRAEELERVRVAIEESGGRAAAYVCRGFVCERPVTSPAELAVLAGQRG